MREKTWLNKNIVLLGLTSFFTDVSSEMLYPLIQSFVAAVLSARKALVGPALGIIEGVAESTAGLFKVFFGYYSDKVRKRKHPTIAGYGLSALSKGLLFLAAWGWPLVLFSRFFDRVGKGMRTAPRDALIAESARKESRGKAFGFHRMMDFAGATLGVLICYGVSLRLMDPVARTIRNLKSFYFLFVLSIIPALIGVFFLFWIHEKRDDSAPSGERPRPNLNLKQYSRPLKAFFLAQFLFTLGNSSNQFLLLRSMSLGYALSSVILMYLLFNLSTTLLSTYFGSWSDRIGRKKPIVLGFFLYALVYLAFGWVRPEFKWMLWPLWISYGLYYALTESTGTSLVSDLSPKGSRATALGFYHTIAGIGLFPASLIAGFLYSVNPGLPFLFGGAMSLLSVAVVLRFVRVEGN